MIEKEENFARFIKRQDYIDYKNHKVLPQAFMLRALKSGEEKGVSVLLLNNYPSNLWKIADEHIPPTHKPALGYANLTKSQIKSCEIALDVYNIPSKKIPQHYEIRPILDLFDKCRMATQLAAMSRLVFAE